jgi:hypothetical protein
MIPGKFLSLRQFHKLSKFSPNPPSPMAIDQHAVVTLTMHCTGVTMRGIICDSGVNPTGMAPHTPKVNGFFDR